MAHSKGAFWSVLSLMCYKMYPHLFMSFGWRPLQQQKWWQKVSLHDPKKRISGKKKKLYQIMPFLWNHGPGKRVSIKEDVSSSWWFQTLGSTGWHHPLSGYVPCWLIKASVSWAQMVWGSLLQPISRLRPVSQSLTMEMITKVQDRGSTITSGVQRGTSNLVTSLPA